MVGVDFRLPVMGLTVRSMWPHRPSWPVGFCTRSRLVWVFQKLGGSIGSNSSAGGPLAPVSLFGAATPISVLAAEVSCLDGRSSRCRCLVGISQWLSS